MPKKPCPPCAISVGVALLHLRHACEDQESDHAIEALCADVIEKIKASYEPMKALGWRKMQYATAMLKLMGLMGVNPMEREWVVMEAHNSLRHGLIECGIAEPTDADLVAMAKAEGRALRANFR